MNQRLVYNVLTPFFFFLHSKLLHQRKREKKYFGIYFRRMESKASVVFFFVDLCYHSRKYYIYWKYKLQTVWNCDLWRVHSISNRKFNGIATGFRIFTHNKTDRKYLSPWCKNRLSYNTRYIRKKISEKCVIALIVLYFIVELICFYFWLIL